MSQHGIDSKGDIMGLGIAAGIAIFFNFAVLKWKFSNGRVADGVLDAAIFMAIVYITSSSGQMGMVSGMIGSALASLYLLWSPLDLTKMFGDEEEPVKA